MHNVSLVKSIVASIKNIVPNKKVYAGKISTQDLVNSIYNFCEAYSGTVLYPYQKQFSKRIIRSVLENDGAEITALFSRQSGKTETVSVTVGGLIIILPQLANMPMFLNDPRFRMFKNGFWVGIFAPSQRQAQTTYNRMRSRLQCKEALAVLQDPDFRLEFTTSNGQTVALSNGSFCTAFSASDVSNIEGESFKFIICEECFPKGTPILTSTGVKPIEVVQKGEFVYSFNHDTKKVELRKVERSFSQPLYGRKMVTITTESGKKITCTDNHKVWVPNKGEYVRADHLRIKDSMSSYMYTTQESEVLHDDNRVQSDDIGVNTRGWLDNISRQEVFKESEVRDKSVCEVERLCRSEVSESKTLMFTGTKDSSKPRKRVRTLQSDDKVFARVKDVLQSILRKWEESNSEKYTGLNDRRSPSLLVSRRWELQWNDVYTHSIIHTRRNLLCEEKIVSIEINEVEEIEVFDLTVEHNHNFFANSMLVHNCQDISNFKIQKSIHPMGAAYNATICKIGTPTTYKGNFYDVIQRNKEEHKQGKAHIKNHFEYNYKVVMKYNQNYAKYVEREKRSLGEHSDAFRLSYNLEWIFSRSMFIDLARLEKECGDEYLNRVPRDMVATHVAGIDVGGGSAKNRSEADSTVVTIVEVDWNNPVVMESMTDPETGEDIVYMAYNTYIKDWLEITTEMADTYEEQFHLIMDYLSNFNLARVVVDATREASLGQRIQANLRCDVMLFTFSSKSKSDLYKHLQTEIDTGRARFPMSPNVVETREYQKFTYQLSELQKGYSGSNLVVSHPPEKGAHDDFPDSWALAVWGTKEAGQVDHTETQDRNKVLGAHKNKENLMFRTKNRITARRR